MESDERRFINRELSWLEFNRRVLAIAEDPAMLPLERAKFLAIFSQNLDEFFQVRVAGLYDLVAAGVEVRSADGLTPQEQVRAVLHEAGKLSRRAEAVFVDEIAPELADEGLTFSNWEELDDDDRKWLTDEFDRTIFPVLTPLAVDPAHPFPYISNLSLNLVVVLTGPRIDETEVARVKVPSLLSRFIVLPDMERIIPVEQVIAAHLDRLFPGLTVVSHTAFRVTRNADLDLEEEEAEDLLQAIELEVRRRRFGQAVRLEVESSISPSVLDWLQRELNVSDAETIHHVGPIDLSGLWSVYSVDRSDLKAKSIPQITPGAFQRDGDDNGHLFDTLKKRDILVHHPYMNFSTTVEEFIRQAATDPDVLAIKLTLYRTSGGSSIVESLIRAAETGKQVVVLVELKARFDEANNIEWARRLEHSGVHVVYGLVGLKTHTKVTLVARAEGDRVRCYCHVGTGNYNAKTAKIYEDIGLFTSDPQVGTDVTHLFNSLTGYGRSVSYRRLLVAPDHLRDGLVDRIRNERRAEPGTGAIVMKMNSLVDPQIIEELYAASQDGVRVRLIVRGICSLRPQVPGLSDNITVKSIVGRYLEHSRVYRFANGDGSAKPLFLMGSADLMQRNLDRRVEALVSVTDPALQGQLDSILTECLSDDTLSWELVGDTWTKLPGPHRRESHIELHSLAKEWAE